MAQIHSLKTKHDDRECKRYEGLRLQLAEIGNQFFEAAQHFPSVHFQLLEAQHNPGSDGWSRWIESHRVLSDTHEFWDVYPAGCFSSKLTLDDLYHMEGQTSNFCGLFKSVSGNLKAAIPELMRLSERANDVRLALEKEVDGHQKLSSFACLGALCSGYRGWLDSVRNTAELNRNAYVDVTTSMWGVPKDRLSRYRARLRSIAEVNTPLDRGFALPCSILSYEIAPDVFKASGNAIRLWLEGVVAENLFEPMYDFEPISIPCSGSSDNAIEVFRSCRTPLPSTLSRSKPRRPKKRGSKGKSEQERIEDKRVLECWMTEKYKTYAELALVFGYTQEDVEKRIACEKRRQSRRKRNEALSSNA